MVPRVFISSRLRELKEERDSVDEAVKELRENEEILYKTWRWETASKDIPSGYTPDEVQSKELRKSDVYLLILGAEYGLSDGISSTHKEYEEAHFEFDKDCILVYVKNDENTAKKREERLRKFLEKIEHEVTYKGFKTKEELKANVKDKLRALRCEKFKGEGEVFEYERGGGKRKKRWEEDFSKNVLRLKHLNELDELITNQNFIETPESKGIKGRSWKEIKKTVYSNFYSFKELKEGEILVIHGDIGIGKTTYMLFFVENILKTSKEEVIFLDSTRIESSLVEIKYETMKFVAVDALGRGGRLKEKSGQLVDFVKNNNAKLIITMRNHEKETFEDVVREKGYEIKTIEPKPPLDVVSYIVANYLLYFKVDADDLKPEEAFKLIYNGDYVRYPKLKKALEITAEKSNVSPFYIYHTISELRRKDLQFELATIKDLPEGVEALLLNTLRKDFIFKGKERKGNKSFLKLLICLRNLEGYYSVYLYETLCEKLKGNFDIQDRVEAFKAFLIVTEDGYEFRLPFYWSEAINKALSRDIKDKWLADEFIRAAAELNPKIIEHVLKGEIEKREINRRYFHLLGCAAKWGLLDYAYVKFKEVEGSRIEDEEYARLFISIGYYTCGFIHHILEQYMKAIEDFSRAIELDPNDYIAYHDRGIAYSKLNQHERAIADLSRTIELNPNNYRGYFNRGSIYYFLNQYERAMDDFNKAIELNPYLADAYSNRGIIYHILKQDDRALKDLNKAIKLDLNDAVKYYNCGVFYRDLKQYKLALRKLSEAIELNPNYAEAYYDLGNIYLDLEEYKSAIKEYGKAIKLRTNYIDAYHNRGGAYLRLEEYKSAIEDFNTVIKFNPNDAGSYYNRGVTYSKLGDYKRAIGDFNKTLELKADYTEAYYERGNTYFKLKEYEMAIRDFDMVIELDSNHIEAYYNRGSAYFELKGYKKAIEDYNKAIELDPNLANSYNQRGLIYDALKKYERAIVDYSKAIELSPNLARVYANRGNAYNALKQHEKAIEDFNKAVELNLNSGGVYTGRGLAYLILGQYEKAISDFKTGGVLFFTSGEKEEAILTFSSTASMRLKGMPQNDDVFYCSIASILLYKGRDMTTKREDRMSKLKKMFQFFIESSEYRMNKNIMNIMRKLNKTQIENEILRKIYELMFKKSKGEEVSEEVERLERGMQERDLRLLLAMLKDY